MTGSEGKSDGTEFKISAAIPQLDLFHRDHPAMLEGPARAWEVARSTVDFACALFSHTREMRPDRQLRDAVVTALFRRALVTTEGAIQLLGNGLLEPALSQLRTILDIELSLKLIVSDSSDRMAKRLAGFHYLTYQKHGQSILGHRATREQLFSENEGPPNVVQVSRSYARFLEKPIFDDVRKDLRASRYWHGFERAQDAFEAIDATSDYLMTYGSTTWFVHAVNVDHDYADHVGDELRLKPLVHRDPRDTQTHLGMLVLRFVSVMGIFIAERGYPASPPFDVYSEVTSTDGEPEQVNAFEALQGVVIGAFPGAGSQP